MNTQFHSESNKREIMSAIETVVKENLGIVLHDKFYLILCNILEHVFANYGKDATKRLIDLNKLCIDEAIKYIIENVEYFPKSLKIPKNTQLKTLTKSKTLEMYVPTKHSEMGNSSSESPIEKVSDQVLKDMLEQRKQEIPYMNVPNIKQDHSDITDPDTGSLLQLILKTPFAIQNPSLVPELINEINKMPHLVEMLKTNPNLLKQQLMNPDFLQMLTTRMSLKQTNHVIQNNPHTQHDPHAQNLANMPHLTNIDYSVLALNKGTHGNEHNQTPSDILTNNVLPMMDDIHLIDYELCLDFKDDLESILKNKYILKFNKYGNLSKIKLAHLMLSENEYMLSQPYIYVKIEELGGRCFTSNNDIVFGKMTLDKNANGFTHYTPDDPHGQSCSQSFSQPISLDKLTLSFHDHSGKSLNLKEIMITKSVKLKKENQLKFTTKYRHKLSTGDEIEIQIHKKHEIDSYIVPIVGIIDDNTFAVNNDFVSLSDKIVIMRRVIDCSVKFQLSEINWNLLTNKNVNASDLVKLSQLIKKSRNTQLIE